MKKLLSFIIALLLSVCIFAQAPLKMSYQCVVRNSTGNLVTNQSIGLKISIHQGSTTGTVVYSETYNPNPQTNANGLVSVEIGTGLIVSGNFSNIDWSAGTYFLETQTDPTGGTNYTIVGTAQLLSVPYALYAKSAGNGFSGNYNDLTNKPILFSGSYPDLTNKPILFDGAWASLTGKPTTLYGYGITDAVAIVGDQTISGVKTFNGKVKVSTPTENSDVTNKEYVDALKQQIADLELALALQGITPPSETVKDADNNIYSVVTIGSQKWMGENLKTTKYNDGTAIPLEKDSWLNPQRPAYCWYLNSEAGYKVPYGALYTWYTVNTGKLCPSGWHVPTQGDWNTLYNLLGVEDYKGAKLKEVGTMHWTEFLPARATNETGFTAVGSGHRDGLWGIFDQLGSLCELWSADEDPVDPAQAYHAQISYNSVLTITGVVRKTMGYSVRCIKD